MMAHYELRDTPTGMKTLVLTGEREIKFHSSFDPVREAQRAVLSFACGRATHIAVCGLGLGYHIKLLREQFPGRTIIVIERDNEIVTIARATYPGHIDDAAVITSLNDVPAALETMGVDSFRGLAVFFHRPSYNLDKEFYDTLLADINRFFSSKLSDLLTRFEFEERWIENIFHNIHKLYGAVPVQRLFGKFRGYPGIIVSAGPSLRANVGALNRLRDRALIVCVDTALKVLLKYNIRPHLVMTIDAQKHSLKHFFGAESAGIPLLADIVSYPRISDRAAGITIFSTTSKYYTDADGNTHREPTPVMDWVERFIPPIGDIQSGGSVATSAFDLLLNLGCSPIILAGQDLAYTGREIHCTGTHHNEGWLAATTRFSNLESINQGVIRKRKIKYVEAYGGGSTVISDYVFDLYKSWFEDSAMKVPFKVINATEGGARIRNTVETTLASLAETLPAAKKSPESVLHNAATCAFGDPSILHAAIIAAIEAVDTVRKTADNALSQNNAGGIEACARAVTGNDVAPLFNPFLRRTNVYLSRHSGLSAEKALSILATDIASASNRLLQLLAAGKEATAKLTPKRHGTI